MDIRIEEDQQGAGCKVWLDDKVVSFPSKEEANAYLAQLRERIEAAAHSFVQPSPDAT